MTAPMQPQPGAPPPILRSRRSACFDYADLANAVIADSQWVADEQLAALRANTHAFQEAANSVYGPGTVTIREIIDVDEDGGARPFLEIPYPITEPLDEALRKANDLAERVVRLQDALGDPLIPVQIVAE